MQYKLQELYNTRYFYLTMDKDVKYLCNTILALYKDKNYPYNVGNELLGNLYESVKAKAFVEIDLANCVITPDVNTTILHYLKLGVNFIDTKDKWRDDLLKLNKKRFETVTTDAVVLPQYDAATSIIDYIKGLDKNVTYQVPDNDEGIYLQITFLIAATRPSIKIYLGNKVVKFFNYIGEQLTAKDLKAFDEFYLTTPEGVQVVNFSNGPVYVQRVGYTDMIGALTVGTLVPTVVGTKQLKDYECFRHIITDSVNVVNNYCNSRKLTLSEILS